MPHRSWFFAAIPVLLLLLSTSARAATDADPLFRSDDILDVTIIAPITSIMRERSEDNEVPGKIQVLVAAGSSVEFDIGIRARGRYRRRPEVCEFAPLRINFRKSQTKDTLLDHQDKLKLVTHCQSKSPRYDQFVIKEYLAYRVLNLIVSESYRARLLRVKYVDTDRKNSERVRLAVFVEHKDRLAKRIDAEVLETTRVFYNELQPAYTNLISVFHYFIGNTDFSPVATGEDKECCHNHTLFKKDGEPHLSVPYDFDISGFVDAPYAAPNPRFHLRNVRQRHYRGRCVNNSHLAASVERFFVQRAAIMDLINSQEALQKSSRKSLVSFVGRFYASLDSAKKINKKLIRDCN